MNRAKAVRRTETGRSERAEADARQLVDARTLAYGVVGAVVLAVRAFASTETGQVDAYAFTTDRLVATVGAVAALIAAIVGGMSIARAAAGRGGRGRRGAVVSLALGSVGLIVGLFIVLTAEGGLGTGNGVGGGYVAIVLSLVGISLGGLTLGRTRRIA